MSDLVQQWLLQLGLTPVPAMKTTCKRIHDLLQSPSADYSQFADIIKYAPGFSLAALRGINSTGNKKNKKPVTDIDRAVPMLGMTWIANTTAALPRINNQLSERQRTGITHCYSQAAHASCYASYLATQHRSPNANEVATIALLYNIGEIALWANPSPIAQKIRELTGKGVAIGQAITSSIDLTIDELNKALRQQWSLPHLDPLLHQTDHTNLERKIYIDLAYQISQASELGWQHDRPLKALQQAAEFLNITPDKLISEIHSITAKIAHKIDPLGLPCSAFNLAFIPQKIRQPQAASTKTEPLRKQEHQPQSSASPIKPQSRAPKTPTPTSAHQPPVPAAVIAPQNHTQAKPGNTRTVQKLISRTMQEIQALDGLSRVVFIVLTRDRKHLIARATLEGNTDSKIRQFKAKVSKQDLFSLLLRKPQTIWMNPEKLVEYARLVPQQPYSLLESENFFAMSLFSKTRPIGLIYADNGANGTKSDNAIYHNFKRLCQRISNELKQ